MFGDNLKIARKSAGMTQKDLADRLGITASAITQIEKGITMPDINRVNTIADILNVSVDQLFRGKTDIIKPIFRPFIGLASCGVPTTYYYDDVEMIEAPEGIGERAYYVRADGDSMTPRINTGDMILCDPDLEIFSGNIVHFEWDGEHGIKRYVEQNGIRMMVAINQEYAPIIITDEFELRMTRCVQVTTKL